MGHTLPWVTPRPPRICSARRPTSVQSMFAALVSGTMLSFSEPLLHCPLTLARLCPAGRGSAACGEQAGALGRGARGRGPAHRGRHRHVGGPPATLLHYSEKGASTLSSVCCHGNAADGFYSGKLWTRKCPRSTLCCARASDTRSCSPADVRYPVDTVSAAVWHRWGREAGRQLCTHTIARQRVK